jgi:protein gp37
MKNTKIEWTDHTWNPVRGCAKVSPGCANCYAERTSLRNPAVLGEWGPNRPRVIGSERCWDQPLLWDRQARREGRRYQVFPNSLSDWLDPQWPAPVLARFLDTMRRCPNLDFLCLTKRPELWRERVEAAWDSVADGSCATDFLDWLHLWKEGIEAPDNICVGASVEDQPRADTRLPALLAIPARLRFLSCEPLLEPVDFSDFFGETVAEGGWISYNEGIHWVIVGGESGPHARPMQPEWARAIRRQCISAAIPFFMKQMGGRRKPFASIPSDLLVREFPVPLRDAAA